MPRYVSVSAASLIKIKGVENESIKRKVGCALQSVTSSIPCQVFEGFQFEPMSSDKLSPFDQLSHVAREMR